MRDEKGNELRCSFEHAGAERRQATELRPLFATEPVASRPMNSLHARYFWSNALNVHELYLITVVHVVGEPDGPGGFKPIVDQAWIDTVFQKANEIWSQACIRLVPYPTGELVTAFRDLPVSGFISCLPPGESAKVEPYDVTAPGVIIVNVFFLEYSNLTACGDPVTGHIFLPTRVWSPQSMGNVFAHELGHVLLNPLGVDDSDNPDHLMFHDYTHPGVPPGTNDGLFLSDCLGARARTVEELFAFGHPKGFGALHEGGEHVPCRLNPRLGNDLVVGIRRPEVDWHPPHV